MDKICLVSLNVNGLCGDERLAQLKTHLEVEGDPDIVFLQETHSNNREVIGKWEQCLSKYKCYFNHGDGRNKGTGILVKKITPFYLNLNGMVQDLDGRYTILRGVLGERLVTLVSVYAPVERIERDGFFGRLLNNNLDGVLYLMGDYNSAVSRIKDRTYNRNRTREDTELIDFMQKSDTKEVWRHLHETRTEYSYIHPMASSRIDLCLVSPEVLDEFSSAEYIPSFSDHRMLKVETKLGARLIGNDFVKIKPHQILDEEFDKTFEGFWWEQQRVFYNTLGDKIKNGTFVGDLSEAIEKLREGTVVFGEKIFLDNLEITNRWWDKFKKRLFLCGKITGKRIAKNKNREYKSLLKEFYKIEEGSARKKVLSNKLKQLVLSITKENAFKAQISDRISFEKCSAPFFSSIKERRKALYIGEVRDKNGNLLKEKNQIEEFLVRCYEELYKEKESDSSKYPEFFEGLPQVQDNVVGEEGEHKIKIEEVEEAIAKAKSGKCPGADGIPIEFYKKYSKLLAPFITKLFNNIIDTGEVPESWETSIMKVIPKNEEVELSFDNLRPLNMGNTDKKLFASVWFRRLVKTSSTIINETQTGGVPGRSIQGSTLLLHLLISYYGEKGLEGYILSLDNAKAFDTIIRKYLWAVMRAFGYSEYTIKSIKKLYKKTKARICINGFLTRAFLIESGVLQGCPLSALLYVISGEPLARAIIKSIEVAGFRLPSNQEVKMIQHVDDMTLMISNQNSILHVLNYVEKYSTICGTVINKTKSFIIKLGQSRVARENNRIDFNGIKIVSKDEEHGCRKVLGVLFSAVPLTYIDKNFLVMTKKCQKILDIWNDRNLSLIGRVLVVNSLVVSKLVYLLQTISITNRRLGYLRARISNFVFSGMGCRLKLNVLEWGKDRGGLGLIPVDLKARALRLKGIKDYLGKRDGGRDEGPISQISAYFLDMTVRATLYRDITEMHQMLQDPVTGAGGILTRRNNRDHVLKYYLEDVKALKYFDDKYQDISRWDSVFYLKKLVEHRTEIEQGTMKMEPQSRRIHFYRQHFSGMQEKQVCKNIFLKGLDTKVQAFSYKLVHNLLSTNKMVGANNKCCSYCKKKNGRHILEDREHIFIKCAVASMVWGKINMKLHRNGMGGIELEEETIIYRLGLSKELSFLVAEVNWALWKNRNNNTKIEHSVAGARVVREMYVKRLDKLMRVDKAILNGSRYRDRWGVLEGIVGFIRDI